MKILFLLNKKSKTSIPITWADFINQKRKLEISIYSLNRLIKSVFSISHRFDILHGHHIKSMYIFLLFNKVLRMKTVYTVHGSYLYLSKSNKKLLISIFRKADYVVFVNKFLYDVIPEDYKSILKNKYFIILNGVDYEYQFEFMDVRKKYSIDPETQLFFHPARFVKEKNHIHLIQAFASFVVKHPNSVLVLAGDGALREDIRRLIKEYDLKNKVKLIGVITRDEVYNFLNQCDLFLMPSISEGLNIAFLEAFSQKANILVSNIPQFTAPLDHYKINPSDNNIIVVEPQSPISIENGMLDSMPLGQRDRNDYSFDLNLMIEKYRKVYITLLNDKNNDK